MTGIKRGFEEYRLRYADLVASINEARIISLVGMEIFHDFPANLPSESRREITDLMEAVARGLLKATKPLKLVTNEPDLDRSSAEGREPVFSGSGSTLAGHALTLYVLKFRSSGKRPEFDFAYRLLAQELVTLIAHFEAFMADSVRTICASEPNLLRRSKNIEWRKVLECGTWEGLVTHLIEEFVLSIQIGPPLESVEFLNKEFGLDIHPDNATLRVVEEVRQIRHLIVHNGCRISQEYNRRTRQQLPLGSVVEISRPFLERAASAVSVITGDTFSAVAGKYFNATDEQLGLIVRRT